MDPYDLPSEEESVLVTLETFSGDRLVWNDVYYKLNDTGDDIIWCTMAVNEYGRPEETVVWYPIIAWAYLPDPYYV